MEPECQTLTWIFTVRYSKSGAHFSNFLKEIHFLCTVFYELWAQEGKLKDSDKKYHFQPKRPEYGDNNGTVWKRLSDLARLPSSGLATREVDKLSCS